MSPRIFLARHGETELNRLGVLQGHQDAPLTTEGVQYAELLGEWLKGAWDALRSPRIWASPLPRARKTAELMLASAGLEAEIHIDARLIEVSGGSFEGLTRAEAVARCPGASGGEILLLRSPDGETWDAVRERVSQWLFERMPEGGDHVVIIHAGSGRILRGLYTGLNIAQIDATALPHAAVLKLEDGSATSAVCEAS